MPKSSTPKITSFLEDIQSISADNDKMTLQIRELFFKFDKNLVEDIKYGGLVFMREKDLIGGIFFYKEHASLEFSHGANLSDPYSVLEGKGKLRRHIKLKTLADIKERHVSHYIKEALER